VAARLGGGGDPDTNPRLRLAMDKAREANMTKDSVQNAIKRGAGQLDGVSYEEARYEGYGPGGAAVLVDCLTDNRTRTVAEVRHAFTKNGGNLGAAGSVSYMFKPRGYIAIAQSKISEEKLMDLALDAGADDIVASGEIWEVYTSPNTFEAVLAAIKKAGIAPEESEIGKYAENSITLEGVKAQTMLKLIEALEDSDDVQKVWSNFDISDKELEAAAAAG